MKTSANKYDPASFDKLWLSASADGGVTLGTLFHHAEQAGWKRAAGASQSTMEVKDLKNARAFAEQNRNHLLFVNETGDILQFGQFGWAKAPNGTAQSAAKQVIADFAQEAANEFDQAHDSARGKALFAHVNFSSTAPRIDAMIALAKSEPGMSRSLADFDANPWHLGLTNGVLDINTLKLVPVSPELLVTKRANVSFDPGAKSPHFDQFLATVQPDQATRRLLQQLAGLFLCGSPMIQTLIFFYGLGANGKSTFIELMHWLLGDYSNRIQTEMLMQHPRSPQGPSPDIVSLKGRRLVYCNEIEENRRLAEARVKELTGGDTLTGRTPYAKENITFQPTHNLVMVGNHAPEVRDMSHGLWRRMLLVPFSQVIPPSQQDPDLLAKLKAEGSGVLNWALNGLQDYRQNDLMISHEVEEATNAYKNEEDILADWLNDHCVTIASASTPKESIYEAYRNWTLRHGNQPMAQAKLTRRLREREFRLDGGRRNIVGLKLNNDGERAAGIISTVAPVASNSA